MASLVAPTTDTTLRPRRSLRRIYWLEAKYEFLKLWRLPAYAVPTIAFPVLFYVLFGLSLKIGPEGSMSMSEYLIATYGCFGVIGATLFGFGVGIATERGQGWMLLKRASPMPIGAYFAAKIALSVVFGTIIVLLLAILGVLFGGVEFPASTWALLLFILVAGAIPFSAMGLLLGYVSGPNSAPAVVNLIYLPMAFASGLWIPVQVLPGFLQKLALTLPPYHYAQLALKTFGADMGEPVWTHLAYLSVFTLVTLAAAYLAYRRDEGKTYG